MKSFSFEVTASVSAVIWRVVHENPTEIMVPPPFLDVFPVDWQGGWYERQFYTMSSA